MKRSCFFLVFLLLNSFAFAQDFIVNNLTADFYLSKDGYFDVVEKYDIEFSQPKHGIFREMLTKFDFRDENGKVQIGAGERLRNSNQVVMLQEDDLFANTDAISEEDAQVITLVMEVLNNETIYDFYETDFKVWNKNSEQMVRGSYRFKLKK